MRDNHAKCVTGGNPSCGMRGEIEAETQTLGVNVDLLGLKQEHQGLYSTIGLICWGSVKLIASRSISD